ncbi:hypothetical protein GCM10017557_34000 [Streptomyces aurantiacus]|uniref:Uncharacterized protein n=1 Tax=Streptomyces aurantiacus TaxID=47760 RepID=A0A7G1P1L6_9ACTN|nr:hypothetical protein GCM10017557_34000 [Streptomyces aurantiacus]
MVGELKLSVTSYQFSLFKSSQRPVQRAVLKATVFPARPACITVLGADSLKEACVLHRPAVESYENIPCPFATYQVAYIMNTSYEATVFRCHGGRMLLAVLVDSADGRFLITVDFVSRPVVYVIGHNNLP